MIHSNDLSAAEPRKGDKVCFLTGKKRGQIGEFKGFAKSDAVVTLDGKDTLHKVEILAAMFK
jgi:ribosomal protein L24